MLNSIRLRIIWFCYIFCGYLFRIVPIKNNRIIFTSYFGKSYGDNPKYISKFLESKYFNKFDIVWTLNSKYNIKDHTVRYVKESSLKYIYYLSTSKVWVDNCRKPIYVRKRKKQFYIQTWHGFAFKKIEKDAQNVLYKSYIKQAKNDSKMIDLIISEANFMTNLYRNSFWYNGNITTIGSPRNDIFFLSKLKDIAKEKVYNTYNLNSESKIILYAPTFRDDFSTSIYSLDFQKLISACQLKFNSKFKILVRFHPNIAKDMERLFINDFVINASSYDDMQELLVSSDIVISDYSSLIFDFMLSFKPVFLLTPDADEYMSTRGTNFSFEQLPFIKSNNNEELFNAIDQFNYEEYIIKVNKFINDNGFVINTNSSEQVADIIYDICSK